MYCEATHGAQDSLTLAAKENLACILREQGHLAAAVGLFREVLSVRKAELGQLHPKTLRSLSHLACLIHDEGSESLEMHRTVLETHLEVLGAQHPDSLTYANNVACALQAVDQRLAEQHHMKVVRLADRTLGSKHPDTLTFRHDQALALRKLGRLKEAQELMEEVLKQRRRLLGKNHLVTRPGRSGLERKGCEAKAEDRL